MNSPTNPPFSPAAPRSGPPPPSTPPAADRALPPQRVPTVTEVVQATRSLPPARPVSALPAGASSLSPDQELTQRVLAGLQRQVDMVVEVRLREAISPLLVRMTDALVRELRAELTSTLQDVVAKAVTQEAAKWRAGRP